MQIISISLFGVLGIISRYSLDKLLQSQNAFFPYSTLLINILGCFLIGLLWHNNYLRFPEYIHQGLTIGFCGGFTTFSSFAIQLINIQQSQDLNKSLIYFALSVILGVMACLAGLKISDLSLR